MHTPPPTSTAVRLLGQQWASAYDCWVNAPGASGRLIYTRPQQQQPQPQQQQQPQSQQNNDDYDLGTNEWPDAVRKHLSLPIFGMTAWNPLGKEHPLEWNRNANQLLETELNQLCSSSSSTTTTTASSERRCWWHGFGFGIAPEWHEQGFIVSIEREIAISLGQKYQQGAIYEYVFLSSSSSDDDEPEGVVLRKTVPILLSDVVEANVRIVTCPRPPIPTSDPNYYY